MLVDAGHVDGHLAVVIQEALECQYAGQVLPLVTHHHHLADHFLRKEFTGVQS